MSFPVRIGLYVALLSVGSVLGLASLFGPILISGWLVDAGLVPGRCAGACMVGGIYGLAGPFLVLGAACAGFLTGWEGKALLVVALAALCYAAALRWLSFDVQYALSVLACAALALALAARAGRWMKA